MKHLKTVGALVAVVYLLSVSCDSREVNLGGPADGEVIIADNVTVVAESTAALVLVAPDTLTFPAAGNESLLSLTPGQVLVSGYKGGFLRKFVSATRQGDEIVVATTQARLTDAVIKGKIQAKLENPQVYPDAGALTSASTSFDVTFNDKVLFAEPGFEVKVSKGSLSFSPSMDLGLEIENSALKKFSLTGTGAVSAAIAFKATVGGTAKRGGEETVLTAGPYYFTQFIGWVPVIEQVDLSVKLKWEAEFTSQMSVEAGTQASGSVTIGANYENGQWTPVDTHTFTWSPIGPTVGEQLKMKVTGTIVAQVDTKFYAVAGPYVNLQPQANFELSVLPEPVKWELKSGAKSEAGMQIEVLGVKLADWKATLFEYEELVASHIYESDGGTDDASDGATPTDVATTDTGSPDGGTTTDGGAEGTSTSTRGLPTPRHPTAGSQTPVVRATQAPRPTAAATAASTSRTGTGSRRSCTSSSTRGRGPRRRTRAATVTSRL